MAARLPNATLKIYPNSGHGGVFQYHHEFVPETLNSWPADAELLLGRSHCGSLT